MRLGALRNGRRSASEMSALAQLAEAVGIRQYWGALDDIYEEIVAALRTKDDAWVGEMSNYHGQWRLATGKPTGGSPVSGLLIEANAVVQCISPDRLVVAVGGCETPRQDRACPPGLPVHRIDGEQVLVGIGDHGELPRRPLVADGIGQMHAIMTDRHKHTAEPYRTSKM